MNEIRKALNEMGFEAEEEFERERAMSDELKGQKHDQGKPPLGLISPIALTKIAQVMEHGAKKYESHGWRKGIEWQRVIDAILRHVEAYNNGEDIDPESGISHMAHAACEVMFLLEFEDTHRELDNRYKRSVGFKPGEIIPQDVNDHRYISERAGGNCVQCGLIPARHRR